MSIQIFASNSLQELSSLLSDDLKKHTKSIFEKPAIVTQTEGMNGWIRIRIAETQGIAANLGFYSPTDIMSAIYREATGKFSGSTDRNLLEWTIFEQLNNPAFIDSFEDIHTYYERNDIKRYALASKLADLFDQYQVYRPAVILKWQQGIYEEPESLRWQYELWHLVRSQMGSRFQDKVEVTQAIMEALRDSVAIEKIQAAFPHIYFFGIAIMTPFHLQVFHELAKHIAIQFYLLNPAPEYYWMNSITEARVQKILQKNKKIRDNNFNIGNDLLLNLGKIIQDSYWLLFQSDELINSYDTPCNHIPEHPTTLLQKIQYDISQNAPNVDRLALTEGDLKDGSVVIQSAYTPVREVELLYNYLMQRIEESPEPFAPRDILVMVCDIDSYAPFIRAVFDNAPYDLPYSIADESLAGGNNFFGALHKLLSLDEDRLTAEKILELLENKYIRNRFSIQDTAIIREAVREAGFRFGTSGSTDNDTRFLSLQYAIKRIKYGICISGGALYDDETEALFPIDNIEGAETMELIRFCHFANQLIAYLQERKTPRAIVQWYDDIRMVSENMIFNPSEGDDDDWIMWEKYLNRQKNSAQEFTSVISFEVFRKGIQQYVTQEKRKHAFLRKGITFCSYIPMRSVPFKMVCMLGLNYDAFPRKEQPLGFSLLNIKTERGDRNLKDNDKHLFLESILSAQQYLYLSYIGNSSKDGTEKPASILLDMFIDYIVKKFPDKEKEIRTSIVVHHPLHGFNSAYGNEPGLVTYINSASQKKWEPPLKPDADISLSRPEKIDIKDLARFMKNPMEWYFNKVLYVYYSSSDLLIPEKEAMELGGLETWKIRDELVYSSKDDDEVYLFEKIRKGQFPLANQGIVTLKDLRNQVQPVHEAYLTYTKGKTATDIFIKDLKIGEVWVSGKIAHVFDQNIVRINHASKTYSHWLEGYIAFLCANLSGIKLNYQFIKMDAKKGAKLYTYTPDLFTEDEMNTCLHKMIEHYRVSGEKLFYFCPQWADPFKIIAQGPDEFEQTVRGQIHPNYGGAFVDPYLSKALAYGYFSATHFESYKENTELFLNPFNKAT